MCCRNAPRVLTQCVRIGLEPCDLDRHRGSPSSRCGKRDHAAPSRAKSQWSQLMRRLVLSGEPDFDYAMIDGTIVSVHQKASGAKGGLKIMPSDARAAA